MQTTWAYKNYEIKEGLKLEKSGQQEINLSNISDHITPD